MTPPPLTTTHLLSIGALALLPSVLWLFYYLRQDVHPEPRVVIIKLFLAGMLLPPFIASAESAVQGWTVQFGFSSLALVFLMGAAFLEEAGKYLAALVIFYHNKEFDEPVDAMIYLIIVALGFAASENIIITLNTASVDPSQNLFALLSLRFLGATLLHTLASGIVGYFIARSHFLNERFAIIRGLSWAILLHSLFNFFILKIADKDQASQFVLPILSLLIGGSLIVAKDFQKLKKYGTSALTEL